MDRRGRRAVLTIDQLLHQDNWVPDSHRDRCHICARSFGTFTRRKHHCRTCGEVVCSTCLIKQSAELPVKGITDVKVCLACVLRHANGLPTRAPPNGTRAMRPSYRETFTGSDDTLSRPSVDYSRPSDVGRESLHRQRQYNHPHLNSGPRASMDNRRQNHNYGHRQSDLARYTMSVREMPPRRQSTPPRYIIDYGYPLDFHWSHPWPKPPVLPDELDRLELLLSYDIETASPLDADFQALCNAAAEAYHAPIAAVAFLDDTRQWFKASVGLLQEEIPRDVSFCAHAMHRRDKPMVVLDTLDDLRFNKNPLVTGRANIRFYASAPICAPLGHVIGTVFVLDTTPRQSCDPSTLETLARDAMLLIHARQQMLYSNTPSYRSSREPQDDERSHPAYTPRPSAKLSPIERQSSSDMENMLVDLLRRTIETQHQLAHQPSSSSSTA
ncbi:unnamed protein product [Aphanomyces euteiches]